MRQIFICRVTAVLFAAVFAALPGAGAAEESARRQALPEGVVAHFSIANPMKFLSDALGYADAATKGTRSHVPGEMLTVLAMAYSPVPFDAFASQRELHVVLPGDYNASDVVVVLSIDDYGALLGGMEENGWDIGGAVESAAPLADLRPAVFPGGGMDMIVADLGDGRAVLARNAELALLVAGNPDWTPAHGTAAAFAARTRVDGGVGERLGILSEMIAERVTGDTENIVQAVAEAGLTEAAGRWLARMAADYSRLVGGELALAREVSLTLDVNGERLSASLAARFADGSRVSRWAEAMEAADLEFPDGKLLLRLPKDFFSAGFSAPFPAMLPDAEAVSARVLSDIAELAPEQKDALLAHNKALFAAGAGATANAGYRNSALSGGGPYQIVISEFDDARAALDAILGMGEIFSGIAANAFADPAESVSFPAEKQSDGEREWYAWRIAPADGERFGEFLERLNRLDSDGTLGALFDPDFRMYAARLETPEALVMASGALGQEEFGALLKGIAESPADAASPFDAPEVKAAQAAMGAACLSLGMLNPTELFLIFARQYAARTGRALPPDAPGVAPGSGPDVFFGGGAEDGGVAGWLDVPAAAVNEAIVVMTREMDARSAARRGRSGSKQEEKTEE